MNSRGKAIVAIFLIVTLLLATLFAFHAVDERAVTDSHSAGANTTSDFALQRDAKPSAGVASPGVDSNRSADEVPPPTEIADEKMVNPPETTGGNMIEVPTFDSMADPTDGVHHQRVAAQCWGLRGSAPLDFVVTLDRETHTSGEASAMITASRESRGYATMFQSSAAESVRGKRVEFSVDLRTRGATRGANLLLRAEDEHGITVAFDNMWMSYGAERRPDQLINRGVTGDSDWSTQHVVVEIPDSARVVTYGVSLDGGGKAWIDNARIEVVTRDMAITGLAVSQWPVPPTILNTGRPTWPAVRGTWGSIWNRRRAPRPATEAQAPRFEFRSQSVRLPEDS